MELAVEHDTTYAYATPLRYTIQYLRLRPHQSAQQSVRQWSVKGSEPLSQFRDGFGNDVEILVVALDPVERPDWREVVTVVAGDVAHLQPERHVSVPLHDLLNGIEGPVNVAERSDVHGRVAIERVAVPGCAQRASRPPGRAGALVAAGTSSSCLSHTKSSLL